MVRWLVRFLSAIFEENEKKIVQGGSTFDLSLNKLKLRHLMSHSLAEHASRRNLHKLISLWLV